MNGKRWIALGAVALIILAAGAFRFGAALFQTDTEDFLAGAGGEEMSERVTEQGTDTGKIAVIHLEGVIQAGGGGVLGGGYDHQLLLDQFDHAAADPEVEGIVFRVNTPGGGVVESDEIHDKVQEVQEEYGKDVYVSMGSQAASGGYFVSAPAERIYANGQTITGSLGVIMQSFNVSELADNLGISDQTIKSGEFKDIMSATREMTDDDEEILQSIVDDAYTRFIDVIENGRDLSRDEVENLADGRIYTGNQAAENGLVDGVGNLDDTIGAMKEDLDRDPDVVEYERGFNMGQFFGMTADTLLEHRRVDELAAWLELNQGPQLMYLYTD